MLALLKGYLLKKASSQIEEYFFNSFKTEVLDKFSKYRVNRFIKVFIKEFKTLSECDNNNEVAQYLKNKMKNEKNSETIYEAFRMVSFSRSKNICPLIIGYMTANAINENRTLTYSEQLISNTVEILYDDELIDAVEFIYKELEKASYQKELNLRNLGSHIDQKIEWESSLCYEPFILHESIGLWALKMKNLGMITDYIISEIHEGSRDDRTGYETDVSLGTTSYITLNKEIIMLVIMIKELHINSNQTRF